MTKNVIAAIGHVHVPHAASLYLANTTLGEIEYTDDGTGSAFLMLHGGMGGYDQGLLLAQALFGTPDSRRIIAVSRPGYLGTPLMKGATAANHADLYAALLDRLRINQVVVAAISAGGPSAIEFAARHPDRCAGLILVSAASGHFDVPDIVIKRLKQIRIAARIPGMARLLGWLNGRDPAKTAARSIRDPVILRSTLEHHDAGPLMLALQRSTFEQLTKRLPGTIADTIAFADLLSLPFGLIHAPSLVIHGEIDAVVPFSHGERSAREIVGAQMFAVPEGEHVCLFTHLEEVRRRVNDFLRKIGL